MFSDLDVKELYEGNGVTVNFPITFNFISGETGVIKVYEGDLNDAKDDITDAVLKTLTTHYTFDDPTTPTQIQMIAAPADGRGLLVKRVSPRTQTTEVSSPISASAVNKQFDRIVHLIQEVDDDVSELEAGTTATTASSATAPNWVTATEYEIYALVVRANVLYRALVAHTAGASFSSDFAAGKWEVLIMGTQGPQGDTGPIGAQGIQGVAGNNGLNGAAGANGIFSAIASQAEAEAGVETTKGINALRVAQAIAAQIPTNATVVDLSNDVDEAMEDVVELRNDVAEIRALTDVAVGRFSGSQKLKNNHGPQALLGVGAPLSNEGRGSPFKRDGDGTEYAEIMCFVRRYNGVDWRRTAIQIVMMYHEEVWYIARRSSLQLLEELELDGITLTVVTNPATKEGQVWYQTDDMGGDNDIHYANSRFQWIGQEIPIGV